MTADWLWPFNNCNALLPLFVLGMLGHHNQLKGVRLISSNAITHAKTIALSGQYTTVFGRDVKPINLR